MMYGLFNGYGGYGGGGFGGMLMMFLFWGLVIWVVVSLIRGKGHMCGHGRHDGHGTNNSSLDILKERYAKGEIDKKEFEEKKKDLGV